MRHPYLSVTVTIQPEICRKPPFQGIFGPFRAKFQKNSLNSANSAIANSLYYKELY
jgi:hypothetical protein